MPVASRPATGDFFAQARAYARIHQGVPTADFIGNLDTRVEILAHGDAAIPCTVNDGDPGEAWVCSPSVTYGRYLAEEVARYLPRALGWPVESLCTSYGRLLEGAQLDRCVILNNWMLSTNLFPRPDFTAVDRWIDEARQRWPAHSIWVRSLNMRENAEWIALLLEQGFRLLPSRQVYLFGQPGKGSHANTQRDFRMLQTTSLAAVPSEGFVASDFGRIEDLYAMLYMNKYSRFNPRYRQEFFRRWHEDGLLELQGFRDTAGVLQAVVGTFSQEGVITAPVVGYNTGLPQSLGLYRLLMASVLRLAMQRGWRVNLSAGAAHFKRLRGGQAEIEYSAVLDDHLDSRHRLTLSALRHLAHRVGIPLMRKFQL
jgi:hypothetical protein